MNHSCLKFISRFGRDSSRVYIRVNFPRNRAKLRTFYRPDRGKQPRSFFSTKTYRRRRLFPRRVCYPLESVESIDRQGKR